MKLVRYEDGPRLDVLWFDEIRLFGFPDPGHGCTLESWAGKEARLFVAFDGAMRVLPMSTKTPPENACELCGGGHPCSKFGCLPGWCQHCRSCGCWNAGRFARGIMGKAGWNGVEIAKVRPGLEHDLVILNRLRVECIARPGGEEPLKRLVGRHVAFWPEFDGVVRVIGLPAKLAVQAKKDFEGAN